MRHLRAIHVVFLRDFKKFLRERSRLLGALARPVVWLLLLGVGLSQIVQTGDGIPYEQYLFPGVLGMTILFAAFMSSISIIWDREFGFLKEILVAPVARWAIVFGKALSGTAIATVQALLLMALVPFLGLPLRPLGILGAAGAAALTALCLSAFGICLASRLRTLESFNVLVNFVLMPMFFLSGAMYPVARLPEPLGIVAHLNPMTYGIDAMKHCLLDLPPGSALGQDFPLGWDFLLLVGFSLGALAFATWSFERSGRD
jgi:ABC-2 type transport system permease protein